MQVCDDLFFLIIFNFPILTLQKLYLIFRSSRTSSAIYTVNGGGNDQASGSRTAQPPLDDQDNDPISDTSPIINQPNRHQLPHTSTDPPNDEGDGCQHWLADSDSSLDETDIDFMDDANREKDVYRSVRWTFKKLGGYLNVFFNLHYF